MRDEEEDIDQECQEGDEQGGHGQDEEGQEVAWRVRRSVEVRGDGETEAYQGEEGGDGVDDEDGGEGVSGGGG